MAGSTTNYQLTKPAVGEAYDVNIFNNNMDIVDTQLKGETTKIRHAEYIRVGQADAPASTPWGPGMFGTTVTLDSGNSKNNGFLTAGAGNDQLKVLEEGVFAFTWTLTNKSGAPEAFWLRLGDPANTFQYGTTPVVTIADGEVITLSIANIYLPINTTVQVRFSCAGANKSVDHRFKITKGQN